MTYYRKRPVVIEAAEWTGDVETLYSFVGTQNWGRADVHEIPWDHSDEEQVVIWNEAERCWLPLPVGHWIVRGVQGEFYPCKADIFRATYEEVIV